MMADVQKEGKVRHVGLSEVTVEQIEAARKHVEVATVQNLYNLANRQSEEVLEYCEREGIGFIPWFPVAAGDLAGPGGALDEIAKDHGATHAQLALAWLLRRSPVVLPIPGTGSVAHLEENCAAADVELSDDEYAAPDEGRRAAVASRAPPPEGVPASAGDQHDLQGAGPVHALDPVQLDVAGRRRAADPGQRAGAGRAGGSGLGHGLHDLVGPHDADVPVGHQASAPAGPRRRRRRARSCRSRRRRPRSR